ncbi:hypothetical protein N665_0167s0015 [Sinapis alba]|nr:hypothetical protein N665_0167s0015 [Sinapis alba]
MTTKPNGKAVISSAGDTEQSKLGSHHRQSSAAKPNGKSPISFNNNSNVMSFNKISLGPQEAELRFRLIHFWEAWNPLKKTLIGLEMLLIDEKRMVVQGFIPPGRIKKFLPHLKQGSVYHLMNFYGSRSKVVFRVAAHTITVSFSHNSELFVIENSPVAFEEERFRFHSYEEFEAGCDLQGDLYDVVGHIRLVNGQSINERPSIDADDLATTRRILVHVQTHDGPVMKLYLWDQAATEFFKKFNAIENTPSVLLVTTVNPKRLGGTLCLTSMTSSRVFIDNDVQQTKNYMTWLVSNPQSTKEVKAEVVTKSETLTIAEIFSYIKQESAKTAFFECTATIDDVVHGSAWYYIGCGGCKTKATKGSTSLMCGKCKKMMYLAEISVYDKSDEAVFVLLGEAGHELTGKHASELVSSYFEANGDKKADFEVPVPQDLLNTIGQTHKFSVKVSEHNLTGKTPAITVTKVLTPSAASSKSGSVGTFTTPSKEASASADDVTEPSNNYQGSATEGVKRMGDGTELGNNKRPKHGK